LITFVFEAVVMDYIRACESYILPIYTNSNQNLVSTAFFARFSQGSISDTQVSGQVSSNQAAGQIRTNQIEGELT
jgi:hypothetical protein